MSRAVDKVVGWSVKVDYNHFLRAFGVVFELVLFVDDRGHQPWGPELLQSWLDVHLLFSNHCEDALSTLALRCRVHDFGQVFVGLGHFKSYVKPSLLDIQNVQVLEGKQFDQRSTFPLAS